MAEEMAIDLTENGTFIQLLFTLLAGAILLYIVTQYLGTKGKKGSKGLKTSALQKGSVQIQVAGKTDSGLAEAKRDFFRSVEAVYVATESTYTSFQDEMKAIDIETKTSFISDNGSANADIILKKLQLLIKQKTGSKSNLEELSNRVIEHIRVAPGISVLLDAQIFPPSMYQPRYTLILAKESVHVVTDGFTGHPSFGPPDPNKKYTENRIRYITDNLLESSSGSVNVSYSIHATTIKDINDAVNVSELQRRIKTEHVHEFIHS